ncbi:MAG: prolipoprotein diacylglyceryl transferase [Myxococcaceae bacterium]
MIPVLFQFSFTTPFAQGVLYLLAVALIIYAAFAGWRGATGPKNERSGEFAAPTQKDRTQRAVIFGVIGAVIARFGLYYALPAGAFLGAKGEGIPIHTYGVMLATGFIMAVTIAGILAQREWRGEEGLRKRDQVMDLAFYVLIGGIVGSRVLFILVNWKSYAANPSEMFSLGGGLVFQGGLIGATIAAWLFTRAHKIDFLRLADVVLPTVALGSAFGRLGCFAAGCCWGEPTGEGSAIGVHFPGGTIAKNLFGQLSNTSSLAYSSMKDGSGAGTGHRWVVPSTGEVFDAPIDGAVRISDWVAQHGHTLAIYPTQLFDSLGNVAFFLVLLLARRFKRFHGQVLAFYLMGYAILRTSVELFRGDSERGTIHGLVPAIPLDAWYNISTGQFISLCMFTLGAAFLVHKGRQVLGQDRVAAPTAA